MKIKAGDTVKILSGKDKGKTGRVVKVLTAEHKVIVEGLNIVIKHKKSQGRDGQGGRIKVPAPLHVSKVMFVDPVSGKPSRLGAKRENGKVARIVKRTGKEAKVEEKEAKTKKTSAKKATKSKATKKSSSKSKAKK